MKLLQPNYEYAGFKYEIKYDGEQYWAFPHAGQHPASLKERHRRAAVEQFKSEN